MSLYGFPKYYRIPTMDERDKIRERERERESRPSSLSYMSQLCHPNYKMKDHTNLTKYIFNTNKLLHYATQKENLNSEDGAQSSQLLTLKGAKCATF